MIATAERKKILYVEDDDDLRCVVSEYLGEMGFIVNAVESGKSASIALNDMAPDLALMDVSLPDMSGLDICKWVRSENRLAGTPVMIISGKTSLQDKVRGFLSGAERYLCKPFTMEDLAKEIHSILRANTIKRNTGNVFPSATDMPPSERRDNYECCSESYY